MHVVFQEGNQVQMESLQEDADAKKIIIEIPNELREGESMSNLLTSSAQSQPVITCCFYFLAGIFRPSAYLVEMVVYIPDPQFIRDFNVSSLPVINSVEITDFELTTGTSCPRPFNSQVKHI